MTKEELLLYLPHKNSNNEDRIISCLNESIKLYSMYLDLEKNKEASLSKELIESLTSFDFGKIIYDKFKDYVDEEDTFNSIMSFISCAYISILYPANIDQKFQGNSIKAKSAELEFTFTHEIPENFAKTEVIEGYEYNDMIYGMEESEFNESPDLYFTVRALILKRNKNVEFEVTEVRCCLEEKDHHKGRNEFYTTSLPRSFMLKQFKNIF